MDISGLLLARGRLESIEQGVETGQISDLPALSCALDEAYCAYGTDEWEWIRRAYAARYGKSPDELSPPELAATAVEYAKVRTKFLKMVLNDAQKEFDELAQIGFGLDGAEGDREADFVAVRGTFEDDKFIKQMRSEIEEVGRRTAEFSEAMSGP